MQFSHISCKIVQSYTYLNHQNVYTFMYRYIISKILMKYPLTWLHYIIIHFIVDVWPLEVQSRN